MAGTNGHTTQSPEEAMSGILLERIEELELALEDLNYIRLMASSEQEFSRDGLVRISRLGESMGSRIHSSNAGLK